ncbi:MAG: ATP-grasp domain-containing protein [Stagnimonas sp.]|nr:ATP-grasp domain-containing protein [Stagnimonas sp.]
MSAARVLLLALRDDWLGPPRLAGALAAVGLEVAALCPAEGPLAASRFLSRRYCFSRGQPPSLEQLQTALAEGPPARVLPMDDAAVLLLRRLPLLQPPLPAAQLAVLTAGGGDPKSRSDWLDKAGSQQRARQYGLAVPDWLPWPAGAPPPQARKLGLPLVLKPVVGYGGIGVRLIGDAAELAALPPPPRAMLLQRHIAGETWACGFYAEHGRLLAAFCAAKERQHPARTGPSSRLRIEAQPALRAATEGLVRASGYSGFGSLDAQIDAAGKVWFLECNPRPSPFLHLGARAGPDLCAALAAAIAGRPYIEPPLRRASWRVALYPQEQLRDPQGRDQGDADWDRPEDDPPLLEWLAQWLRRQGPAG